MRSFADILATGQATFRELGNYIGGALGDKLGVLSLGGGIVDSVLGAMEADA